MPQPPDLFPAWPSVVLRRPAGVGFGVGLEYQLSFHFVVDLPSANSQARSIAKMLKAPLKVIRGKAEVAIEFHYEFPVVAAKGTASFFEIQCNAPRSFPPIFHDIFPLISQVPLQVA